MPWGWRMAWYEPQRGIGVYYPAPIHVIVRLGCEVFRRAGVALRAPTPERDQTLRLEMTHSERQRLAEEFANGYAAGWNECFAACTEAVHEEFARSEGAWRAGDVLTEKSTNTQLN